MNKVELQNQYNTLIKEHQDLKLTRKDNPDLTLENHHINPTALGGGNEPENMVMLTAQAHWEAHKLLSELDNNRGPMQNAFWWMCITMRSKGVEISAEEYEKARRSFIETQTGRVASKETLARMSAGNKGRPHSEEHKRKISIANSNKDVYIFEHKDGNISICSKYNLGIKYNLNRANLGQLINGKRKTVGGWKLIH